MNPLQFTLIEKYFYNLKISRKNVHKVSKKEQIFARDQENLIMELV